MNERSLLWVSLVRKRIGWYECYNEKESPGDSNVDSKRRTPIPGQCRDLCLWNSSYNEESPTRNNKSEMEFIPVIHPLLGKWVQLTYFLWGDLVPVVTI